MNRGRNERNSCEGLNALNERSVEVTVKEGSGVHSPFPVSFLPSLMPFMPYGQLHYSERPVQLSVSGNERES